MSGRVLKMGLILGQQANVDTRYIPGSGVGAVSTSVRRALMRRANDAYYPNEDNASNSNNCACKLGNPSNLAFPYEGMN